MTELKNTVLNALQSQGYDLISALNIWRDFVTELKSLPSGKHTYYIGNVEISFKKE